MMGARVKWFGISSVLNNKLIINRTLRGRLEIRNFSSGVEKYILTLEEKFRISALPCYNLFFFSIVKSHLP